MPRFATDKDVPHGYIPDYVRLAEAIGPAGVVCEVGVAQGLSLDMWQELFPDGLVIGVDSNPGSRWPQGCPQVIAGQDDPGLGTMVAQHAPSGCDLIVDDASHIGRLSAGTIGQLWPLVRPGGYYVVEDWADPWVTPEVGVADPADRLVDWVPSLITALRDGAASVTYTYEGLVIIRRKP
jgi:hypothetical protein